MKFIYSRKQPWAWAPLDYLAGFSSSKFHRISRRIDNKLIFSETGSGLTALVTLVSWRPLRLCEHRKIHKNRVRPVCCAGPRWVCREQWRQQRGVRLSSRSQTLLSNRKTWPQKRSLRYSFPQKHLKILHKAFENNEWMNKAPTLYLYLW